MAESAFMIEPLSDSMEEDIFPVSRRSVGLNGKREERERERGVSKERVEMGELYVGHAL
jgi:hypothetical protein